MVSIKFGTNTDSLNAQLHLKDHSAKLSKTFERLSSGLRINTASDDPAGIALAATIDSDRKIYSQGLRNLNDGISLVNVAESAITELTNIVTRLQELSEQAANGSYSTTQRSALDSEAQALSAEYSRIISSTTFNGKDLLKSTFGTLSLQAGYGPNGSFSSSLGGVVGTGTFGTASSFSAGGASGGGEIAVGDLNADGYQDLISLNAVETAVYIRLGQAGGSFGTATSYNMGSNTLSLAVDDLNSDGILDIVVGSSLGYVNTRLGAGNGTFGSIVSSASSANLNSGMVLGDVNSDGYADLVASLSGGSIVQLGQGDGSFGTAVSYTNNATSTLAVNLADINGDGNLDLIDTFFSAGTSNTFSVRLGQGNGTFGASNSYLVSAFGGTVQYAIQAADINKDGRNDIIMSGTGSLTVSLQQADGTFGSASSYTTTSGTEYGLVMGDFNGDGNIDAATASAVSATAGATTVFLNNGNGTFATGVSYAGTGEGGYDITATDLNSDGVLDLIMGNEGSTSAVSASVYIGGTQEGTGGLLSFSLKTQAKAIHASNIFADKLDQLSAQHGKIAAFQARTEVAANNLYSTVENLFMARSRIVDADIASETSEMVRLKVLQQSTVAVLAQANQQPSKVLELLK